MAILNPSFESTGSWTYSENDTNNKLSGARSTEWADDGSWSYKMYAASGAVIGDWCQILQNVTITKNALKLTVRWWIEEIGSYGIKIQFGSNTIYDSGIYGSINTYITKTIVLDMTAHVSQTNDLKLIFEKSFGTNVIGILYWDNLIEYDGNYYVKTTGDDAKDGLSWANAWKTINKAATTVTDGVIVRIGFGTYDAEPAANKIAPQNVGASGIEYLPETATTGGGTGTVSIEQNS